MVSWYTSHLGFRLPVTPAVSQFDIQNPMKFDFKRKWAPSSRPLMPQFANDSSEYPILSAFSDVLSLVDLSDSLKALSTMLLSPLNLGILIRLVSASTPSIEISSCMIPRLLPRAFQSTCQLGVGTSRNESHDGAENFITGEKSGTTHTAWSYEPFCLYSEEAHDTFCVYTSSKFGNGRGISIIASAKEAARATDIPVFQSPGYFEDEVYAGSNEKDPRFEQRPVRDRGSGVVAAQSLRRGDRIFSHTPILAVHDAVMQTIEDEDLFFLIRVAINRLPPATGRLFMNMAAGFGGDPYFDRLNTNAFAIHIGRSPDHFWTVSPESARLNHDCRPNTAYYFDPVTLTHNIHISRAVAPGDELTISYINPYLTWLERQKVIKGQYNFSCTCSQCLLPPMFTNASDVRLSHIAELEAALEDTSERRTASTKTAELLISLYEQERLDGAIAQAYTYAALEYAYAANESMARKYATLAVEGNLIWRGPRHSLTMLMEGMMDEPEATPKWNWTAKLKAAPVVMLNPEDVIVEVVPASY